MKQELTNYYNNIEKPWGQLFYDVVKYQLSFAANMEILDFGSGFGKLSDFLAENNKVTAIEPNLAMVNSRFKTNEYTQITGGLTELKSMPDNSFDLIVCHNVLEYALEREEIINEFYRVLRKNGILSIVKHNHNGRIMQKIVFENNIDEAIALLNGGDSLAQCFGKIYYYDINDIKKWNDNFILEKIYGIRTFWALQQNNELKFDKTWKEKILKAELSVSEIDDFIKISFFNHILLRKNGK